MSIFSCGIHFFKVFLIFVTGKEYFKKTNPVVGLPLLGGWSMWKDRFYQQKENKTLFVINDLPPLGVGDSRIAHLPPVGVGVWYQPPPPYEGVVPFYLPPSATGVVWYQPTYDFIFKRKIKSNSYNYTN